jgi:glycosyltransferase involved in cell wall biosynthesis
MKFCFLGNAAGSLNGKTPGGGELQIALLAKALAAKGHEVVIIDTRSDKSFMTEEGVSLIHIPTWNKGLRGFRIFRRFKILKKVLTEQNADFYYGRMRTYYHLLSYKVARKLNKKFILAIASDIDVLSLWEKIKNKYADNFNFFDFLTLHLPNDLVFHYLLKNSDFIAVQHLGQKDHLKEAKPKVILFPNIIANSSLKMSKTQEGDNDYFIYAGALTTTKGSDNLSHLVDIIDKEIKIVIVGNPMDSKSKNELKKILTHNNVTYKGRLPQQDTIQLIANSKALINTSNFEGFPNIFLEAWANGVPVISWKVNPGNVITNHHLGFCCDGDFNEMKSCIESNKTSAIDKEKLILYVSLFHSFTTAAERFLDLLG